MSSNQGNGKKGETSAVLLWFISLAFMLAAVVFWVMSTRLDEVFYTILGWICLVPGLLVTWWSNSI